MTTTTVAPATDEQVEELAGRLFGSCLGAVELYNVYLGLRLDLYRALEAQPGQTGDELAAVTGLAPRYLREWLQAQAISGLILIDGDDIATGRYSLAPGVHEALVDETSPAYVGALAAVLPIVGRISDDLVSAFRTGAGVAYEKYGPEAVTAQEAMNRPGYEHSLVAEWLPQMPDVLARLQDTTQPARVADVCCGAGWSSIVLAEAFDHVTVDGFDSDEDSIARARRNAAERGVSAHTRFEVVDVSSDGPSDLYDVAFVFEAIHDLARPVEALAGCRRALKPGAPLIVMDENVAATLTAPGDEVERLMANLSSLWCTPQGHGPGSEVVGAVMRPHTMTDLARRAGFTTVDILPIEHPFFRFYRIAS